MQSRVVCRLNEMIRKSFAGNNREDEKLVLHAFMKLSELSKDIPDFLHLAAQLRRMQKAWLKGWALRSKFMLLHVVLPIIKLSVRRNFFISKAQKFTKQIPY